MFLPLNYHSHLSVDFHFLFSRFSSWNAIDQTTYFYICQKNRKHCELSVNVFTIWCFMPFTSSAKLSMPNFLVCNTMNMSHLVPLWNSYCFIVDSKYSSVQSNVKVVYSGYWEGIASIDFHSDSNVIMWSISWLAFTCAKIKLLRWIFVASSKEFSSHQELF